MKSKKGSKFEREFSKTLSRWYSRGRRGDLFYKSTGSGSRATMRAKQGKKTANSYGDIMAMDPIAQPFIHKYHLELKRGYTQKKKKITTAKIIDILSLVDFNSKNDHMLIAWVKKCLLQMSFSGQQHFFIVLKRDFKNAIVITARHTFELIHFKNHLFRAKLHNTINIVMDPCPITIFSWKDFTRLKPSSFVPEASVFKPMIKRRR